MTLYTLLDHIVWHLPYTINLTQSQPTDGILAMTVSEKLRKTIENSPSTLYRLAKEADIDWGTLQRFVNGTRPNIRIETVDKLCALLGLELKPKAGKKPTARRKS